MQFRLHPLVVHRSIDGEGLLLHLQSDECFQANPSADLILSLLATGQTESSIIDILIDSFDVDRPTCTQQVKTFLQRLQQLGIAEPK